MTHSTLHLHPRPVVLVVDDQPASLHLLCSALSDTCDVLVATSAEAALAICRQDRPELVLMDVVMPGMGGLRGCELIHAEPGMQETPVIFVTAMATSDEESACWEAGGVDFVGKPPSPLTVRNRVAVHLRLKRMADKLRRSSLMDELTGLANRRAFEQAFLAAWGRACQPDTSLSLLLVDVDWFKAFNDHYGHAAGDEALRTVARELTGALRGSDDLVARIGGEEFAVLLPQADADTARAVAGRIVEAFRALGAPHAGSPGGTLSVSLGGATCLPVGPERMGWLLQRADESLYAAKAAGRGRFEGGAHPLP